VSYSYDFEFPDVRIETCVVFALLVHAGLWTQTAAGSQITGTVQDSSGSAIIGAVVRVTQTETGLTRTAESGIDGVYRLPDLPIGPYKLEATQQAFGTYVQTGIVLQVNINPTINITLQVGAAMQVVQIEANAGWSKRRATRSELSSITSVLWTCL